MGVSNEYSMIEARLSEVGFFRETGIAKAQRGCRRSVKEVPAFLAAGSSDKIRRTVTEMWSAVTRRGGAKAPPACHDQYLLYHDNFF